MQKVVETVGNVDVVLANGDLADVTDRAYDWFDADNAFFRVMQGRAAHKTNGVEYKGGAIVQNAPLFTSIGNTRVIVLEMARIWRLSQVGILVGNTG